MNMDRRVFMTLAGTTAGLAMASGLKAASSDGNSSLPLTPIPATRKGDMYYRPLGRTGETVSIIGVGGYHLGFPSEAESLAIVRRAVDSGVTFMDNSWDYHDGESEKRLGKALEGGYRDKVFLMTKIDGRDAKTAASQIDESLHRLKTDHVDLMQFHEIIRLEDPDRIFAPDGALRAMLEAKKAGKVRFIGFTGHKDPLVHLRMLEIAAKHDFHFDTAQMPLNVMDAHFRSFAHQVVPELVRQEIGVLGMKSMGSGDILKSKVVSPVECLHYAMSLPTATVITGIDSQSVLDQALNAAKTFAPMDHDQIMALLDRTKQAAAEGNYERFKTTNHYDSTANNPAYLGPPQ